MLKINEYVTVVEKKEYPYVGIVKEIMPNGSTAKCLFMDPDGCFYKEYALAKLRHYSAKEMADDIFRYFNEEEPNIECIYSSEYVNFLIQEVQSQTKVVKQIKNSERKIVDPEYDNFTSQELAEIQHREEFAGMLSELRERIEKVLLVNNK